MSSPVVARYIDLLVDLQLVRRLHPWSGNVGKRLVKAPKVYVRDSGLVHALLDLGNLHDLADHPVCGPSFEGFCIDNLMAAASPQCTPYSYRTHAGAERFPMRHGTQAIGLVALMQLMASVGSLRHIQGRHD